MAEHKTKRANRIPNPKGREGQPISLYPLSFEEALSDALQVKPPPKEKAAPKRKRPKKQGD